MGARDGHGGPPALTVTLARLNELDCDAFVDAVGFVFERSPWVAQRAWERRPFASVHALHLALCDVVEKAPLDAQLALVNAHPDLAGKAMQTGKLTGASDSEQRAVGLDRLSRHERDRLLTIAAAFHERFGFPCVVCVRNHKTPLSIIEAIERRGRSTPGAALDASIREVFEIARLRLSDTLAGGSTSTGERSTGYLTSHVLDTVRGVPGAGMTLELWRYEKGAWRHLKTTRTNPDGRTDEPLLEGDGFLPGRYELRFNVERYFAESAVETSDPPYLGEVPVRFTVTCADEHYHVPLIVAPWGYSTYRGS
jgi:2-oxo-4-hydroxy-4-carboxy-5-ureidoimidazoline decarboxylase